MPGTDISRRAILAAVTAAAFVGSASSAPRRSLTTAEAIALRNRGHGIDCFLDGQRMTKVLDGDAEAGWLLLGVPHPVHGGYQLDPARNYDFVLMEKRYGRVELVPNGKRLPLPDRSDPAPDIPAPAAAQPVVAEVGNA